MEDVTKSPENSEKTPLPAGLDFASMGVEKGSDAPLEPELSVKASPTPPPTQRSYSENTSPKLPKVLTPKPATTGSLPLTGTALAASRHPLESSNNDERSDEPECLAEASTTGQTSKILVTAGKSPVVIETRPPLPRAAAASNPQAELDPGLGQQVPEQPPPPPPTKGLPPKVVAVFGAVFGVATIASILAVLIHLDGSKPSLTPSASATITAVAPPSPLLPGTTPVPAKTAAPSASEESPSKPSVPEQPTGPWRVSHLKDNPDIRFYSKEMGKDSLVNNLKERHIKKSEIYRVLKSFKDPKVFDKANKHHRYSVAVDRKTKKIKGFEYQISVSEVYQSKENSEGLLVGTKLELQVVKTRLLKKVLIGDSVRASLEKAELGSDIIKHLELALEGRAHPLGLSKGSTLRLVLQEQTVQGKHAAYADLEALEYAKRGSSEPLRIYHLKIGAESGYFNQHGKAPYNKGGWQFPVKFPRVTSRFNPKRLHPILKTVMPHNGTDFGAPKGTPVFAANFGTVTIAGPHGASGNLVTIEHAGGIQTGYAHLSRFAPGIKPGDKVESRQLIGYVGSTGRSTGPHLHFSAKKNGKFFDAQTLQMKAERLVPADHRSTFAAYKAEMDKLLDSIQLPESAAPKKVEKEDPPSKADPKEDLKESSSDNDDNDSDDSKNEPEKSDKPEKSDSKKSDSKASKKEDESPPATPSDSVDSAIWKPGELRLSQNPCRSFERQKPEPFDRPKASSAKTSRVFAELPGGLRGAGLGSHSHNQHPPHR
jgi:murein DD-endopeptidase MepM/ murein hydrolase activator NlpD